MTIPPDTNGIEIHGETEMSDQLTAVVPCLPPRVLIATQLIAARVQRGTLADGTVAWAFTKADEILGHHEATLPKEGPCSRS